MSISKWIFYGRRRTDWLGDFDFPWEFGRENAKWFCVTCAKMGKKRELFKSAELLVLSHTIRNFVDFSNVLYRERNLSWLLYSGFKRRLGGSVTIIKSDSLEELAAIRAREDTRYLIPLAEP